MTLWLHLLPKIRLVLFAIIWVKGCIAADENPCTLHDSGKYYDLSPLKSSKDYEFKTPGDHTFTINACRSPIRETFGLRDVDERYIGGFVRRDHGDFSIGALNTTLSMQDSRPRLAFSDGSRCKSKSSDTEIRASTVIEFVCDTSVFESGMPRLVAQLPPGDDEDACAFVLEWRTHVACPTNEPGGAWGFFGFVAVITVSLVIMYLVFGTLYNRYVLRLRGAEQIPQFSITSMKYHAHEALDWMKDLAIGMHEGSRSIGTTSGLFERPGVRSDSELGLGGRRRTNTNPVSHQSQTQAAEGGTRAGSGGGFVRPSRPGIGLGTAKREEINPVSHQAQSSASQKELTPPLSVMDEEPRLKSSERETAVSTKEERAFMLGDEDEEGEDVGVTLSKSVRAPTPQRAESVASIPSQGGDAIQNANVAAAMRGRDLGGGDVTRL